MSQHRIPASNCPSAGAKRRNSQCRRRPRAPTGSLSLLETTAPSLRAESGHRRRIPSPWGAALDIWRGAGPRGSRGRKGDVNRRNSAKTRRTPEAKKFPKVCYPLFLFPLPRKISHPGKFSDTPVRDQERVTRGNLSGDHPTNLPTNLPGGNFP